MLRPMSGWAIGASVVVALVAARLALALVRRMRHGVVAPTRIVTEEEHTETDERGAVRSVQAAELRLPVQRLDEIWNPMHLERLARTYWRFLSRVTLGLIRVSYTPTERFVVFLTRPFVLLRFKAPEYEMDEHRGVVRWRIERGLLVAPPGHEGDGYLQVAIRREEPDADHFAVLHVEVEVANFYPTIAWRLSRFIYTNTQSRVHVIVTHGFLRSLSRLDLAESKVGRFASTSGRRPRRASGE
jgi:hypothetical protein